MLWMVCLVELRTSRLAWRKFKNCVAHIYVAICLFHWEIESFHSGIWMTVGRLSSQTKPNQIVIRSKQPKLIHCQWFARLDSSNGSLFDGLVWIFFLRSLKPFFGSFFSRSIEWHLCEWMKQMKKKRPKSIETTSTFGCNRTMHTITYIK